VTMPLKIFQASGHDGIKKMEAEVTDWLRGIHIVNRMSTAASSVKDKDNDEVYQHLIITFLFDEDPRN